MAQTPNALSHIWGEHNFGVEWQERDDLHIVCDIVGGATSPRALEGLGAPDNRNLKHVENLHSKVYISDEGAVVGSANASAGGLGSGDRGARLLVAGTLHPTGSLVWNDAATWFDCLFGNALPVHQEELAEAEERYRRAPRRPSPQDLKRMGILQSIAACPDYYSDRGFGFIVCANNNNTREEVVRDVGKRAHADVPRLSLPTKYVYFSDWTDEDIRSLGGKYICFILGTKGGVYVRQLDIIVPSRMITFPLGDLLCSWQDRF